MVNQRQTMENKCRLCFHSLISSAKPKSVFEPLNHVNNTYDKEEEEEEDEEEETISTLIEYYFRITVSEDDAFSKRICAVCCEKLIDLNAFKRLAIESDAKFRSMKTIKIEEEATHEVQENTAPDLLVVPKVEKGGGEARSRKKRRVKKTRKTRKIKPELLRPELELEVGKTDIVLREDDSDKDDVTTDATTKPQKKPTKTGAKKDYQCEFCGKILTSARGLHLHLYLHNGLPLPDLECKICGKVYHHRNSLFAHRKTHEAPTLQCDQCGHKFTRRHDLFRHIRVVHEGVRAYRCHLCAKCFGDDGTLRYHMRSHSDEKLFECTACGGKYKYLQQIQKHIAKHHSNNTGGSDKEAINTLIKRLKPINPFRLGKINVDASTAHVSPIINNDGVPDGGGGGTHDNDSRDIDFKLN